MRRWALLSWFFLTIGIMLGMWWAYVELGWGGYWAWDPVENASLLPWLTGTAFLHSIMIQEKRGMLRKWNVTLVVTTFLLVDLRHVHHAQRHHRERALVRAVAGRQLVRRVPRRWRSWRPTYLVATRLKDLEAKAELESMVSREAAFLYNNLVLVGIAFSVLWGTLFPIISEAVRGSKITVGPPFFNTVNIPLGLLLLALTGVGPLIAWRRASVSNLQAAVRRAGRWRARRSAPCSSRSACATATRSSRTRSPASSRRRSCRSSRRASARGDACTARRCRSAFVRLVARNRRRYGGYIVHVGIVVLFAAFAGLAFKKEYDVTLQRRRDVHELVDPLGHRWTFVEPGRSRTYEELNRQVTAVGARGVRATASRTALITSEKRQHVDSRGKPTFEPSTEVGIRESLRSRTSTSCSPACAARRRPRCASPSTRSWCGCGSAA